jgi:hypothetical protein
MNLQMNLTVCLYVCAYELTNIYLIDCPFSGISQRSPPKSRHPNPVDAIINPQAQQKQKNQEIQARAGGQVRGPQDKILLKQPIRAKRN